MDLNSNRTHDLDVWIRAYEVVKGSENPEVKERTEEFFFSFFSFFHFLF